MMQYITNFAVTFAQSGQCNGNTFFGLKPWFWYLEASGDCEVVHFQVLPTSGQSDLLLIGLVIVDDLLRIAGMVAIGFIIYGGIEYVTSQGSPEQASKAQNTIQNAIIGLVVALLAVAAVSFLGNSITT